MTLGELIKERARLRKERKRKREKERKEKENEKKADAKGEKPANRAYMVTEEIPTGE